MKRLELEDATASPAGDSSVESRVSEPMPSESVPQVAPKSWWVRIDEAEARGAFTPQDRLDAGPWTTCACGQQDPRIPRFFFGQPRDSLLSSLGIDFCLQVGYGRPAGARQVLSAIEKRSTEILFELGHLTLVREVLK